jgi:hypothetical protein
MGANFCHVIKIEDVFHSIISTILMNHCWNGEDPILIIKAVVDINIIILIILFFISMTLRIKILDDTDWMIKYFILLSLLLFFIMFVFMIEQNARVFNSNIIQIAIHEFIMKQEILEVIISIRRIVCILVFVKLQI